MRLVWAKWADYQRYIKICIQPSTLISTLQETFKKIKWIDASHSLILYYIILYKCKSILFLYIVCTDPETNYYRTCFCTPTTCSLNGSHMKHCTVYTKRYTLCLKQYMLYMKRWMVYMKCISHKTVCPSALFTHFGHAFILIDFRFTKVKFS